MTAELAGKVALVTGGASGIGLASVQLLAARGAAVAFCDLDQQAIDDVVASLAASTRVFGTVTDVTDDAAVRGLVDETVHRFGKLDILVTAAGIQRYSTAADTSADMWDEVMAVNLKGCFLAAKHVVPHMRAQHSGSIVIISSVQAYVTQAAVAAYSTSKGALNALARSIALDEARYGIRANAVCPGSVDTPMLRASAHRFAGDSDDAAAAMVESWGRMHPIGRVAKPSEIAEAVAFLASDRSSFITGIGLPVDGGLLAAVAVALPD